MLNIFQQNQFLRHAIGGQVTELMIFILCGLIISLLGLYRPQRSFGFYLMMLIHYYIYIVGILLFADRCIKFACWFILTMRMVNTPFTIPSMVQEYVIIFIVKILQLTVLKKFVVDKIWLNIKALKLSKEEIFD